MVFFRNRFIRIGLLSALAYLYATDEAAGQGCNTFGSYNLGPDVEITCVDSCVTVTAPSVATVVAGGGNSYAVSEIPYVLPFPFSQGTALALPDDTYSSSIPIGFPFQFYGASYSNVWVSSNGYIRFTAPTGTFSPFVPAGPVPNPNMARPAVFAVYHDINPATCGSIRTGTYGVAPCRRFVVNFNAVCQYSCTNQQVNAQIVLYEGTNVVEVYIGNKPICAAHPNTVVGIQNATGTIGIGPTGYTFGQWSATNKAWRFANSQTVEGLTFWYEDNELLGTGPTIDLCASASTTITGALGVLPAGQFCGNHQISVSTAGSATNNAQVSWSIVSAAGVPYASGTAPYTGSVCLPNGCYTVNMTDSGNNGWGSAALTITPTGGTAFGPFALATGGSGTANFCATAYTGPAPTLSDYDELASDELNFIAVSDADASFNWSGNPCSGGNPVTLNPVTPGGSWQVNCNGCFNEQTLTFNPALAGTGSFPVTYTVPGTCFADVVTNNVVVGATPTPVFASPGNLCIGTNYDFNSTPAFGAWTASCGTCINQNTGFFFSNSAGSGSHTITFTTVGACPGTASTVVNVGPPQTAALSGPSAVCSGGSAQFTSTLPGTWTSNCIGCMNSSNGVFSPGLAFTGNYTITFTPTVACPTGNSTTPIQVNPGVAITAWEVPELLCSDAPPALFTTDAPGGTWTADCGACISTNGTFDPAVAGAGSFPVSYMVSNAACADSMSWEVAVATDLSGSYVGATAVCIGEELELEWELDPSIPDPGTGIGGVWSVPTCATCVDGTGMFAASTAGSYPVIFDFDGSCDVPVEGVVNVVAAPNASINAPVSLCETASAVPITAATPGGVWSATCTACFTGGLLDPGAAGPGTVSLTYTVTTACTSTATVDVEVEPELSGTMVPAAALCLGEQTVLDFTFDADIPADAQATATGSWGSPNCPSCILNAVNGSFIATNPGTVEVVYTFGSACSEPINGTVVVGAPVNATLSPVPELCESEVPIQLTAAEPGGVWTATCGDCIGATGLFDPAAAGPGVHTVTYSIADVCSDTDALAVEVAIQRDAAITLQELICLDAETWIAESGWPNGVWTADCVGCISSTTGEIDLLAAGVGPLEVTYTLSGLCGDEDTAETYVEGCTVEFVNVFTPNGDDSNETLQFPYLPQFPDHLLRIFDRWGQVVLETTQYQNDWTGEGAAEGTYYYTLTINNFGTFSGDFTLLR